MRTLAGIVALAALLGVLGCSATVTDPTATVATIQLYADDLGALLSTECVSIYKEEGCSRYPNPLACDKMRVAVRGDGSTCAVCNLEGGGTQEMCGGPADGIPILCHTTEDLACQQCVDIYGNTVMDSCNRGALLYRARGGGWSQTPGNGSGWLGTPGEDPPQTPPTNPPPANPPPGNQAGKCDPTEARNVYARELNKILAQEGLKFSYAPDLSKTYDTSKGYWSGTSSKQDMCKYWLTTNSVLATCWSNVPGKCHCQTYGSKETCKCARINVFALRAACVQIPTDCEYDKWVGNMVMEYGVATNWLFSANYGKGYYGGLPSNPNGIPQGYAPQCQGSPLVLDLGGDGIATTTVENGVRFDLEGHGVRQNAWLARGDDALLVLDRNGNGRIDDGTELFGSGTDIGGVPADQGFEALSLLDRPSQGGNGNGILEAGDLMFAELRLWQDRNGDGVTDAGELLALEQAGVASLELTGRQCGMGMDPQGNDQSLRAAFTRADGSRGSLVDVYFNIGR